MVLADWQFVSRRLWPLVSVWFEGSPPGSDPEDPETRTEYDIRAVDLYEMAAQQVGYPLVTQHTRQYLSLNSHARVLEGI